MPEELRLGQIKLAKAEIEYLNEEIAKDEDFLKEAEVSGRTHFVASTERNLQRARQRLQQLEESIALFETLKPVEEKPEKENRVPGAGATAEAQAPTFLSKCIGTLKCALEPWSPSARQDRYHPFSGHSADDGSFRSIGGLQPSGGKKQD